MKIHSSGASIDGLKKAHYAACNFNDTLKIFYYLDTAFFAPFALETELHGK